MSTAHTARKRFGQNFLQDSRIITDIVNAVHPQPDDIVIEIDLNEGDVEAKVWTCDFSYEYVKINGEYHT